VYYSRLAVRRILQQAQPGWFFGRTHRSRSKNHGELFAVVMDTHLWDCAEELRDAHAAGKRKRLIAWDLYGKAYGKPSPQNFSAIDDETEDLDTWGEYQAWLRIWRPEQAAPAWQTGLSGS